MSLVLQNNNTDHESRTNVKEEIELISTFKIDYSTEPANGYDDAEAAKNLKYKQLELKINEQFESNEDQNDFIRPLTEIKSEPELQIDDLNMEIPWSDHFEHADFECLHATSKSIGIPNDTKFRMREAVVVLERLVIDNAIGNFTSFPTEDKQVMLNE